MRRLRWMTVAVLLLSATACRSSIDLSTDRGQMRFGVQAAEMDLWREAQFRFLRAVQMNPQDPMAYNNLAVAYEGIGEYEKAREAYLRALQIDRSNQYIQRNYSRFVEFHSKRNPEKGESSDADETAGDPSTGADDADETGDPEEPADQPATSEPDPDDPPVQQEAGNEPDAREGESR